MQHKNEEIFHVILKVTVIVGIVASIALLITKRDAGPTVAFDLLAYVISFTALVLTTLQSISIARQVRITQNAATKITEALHSIEALTQADQKLYQSVEKDSQLDQKIVEALSLYGVGSNEKKRQQIAQTVRKNIQN